MPTVWGDGQGTNRHDWIPGPYRKDGKPKQYQYHAFGTEFYRQCKGTSKSTGERCKRRASPGREWCQRHGGQTARGTAHVNLQHGRYSRAMPARLVTRYVQSLEDTNQLVLRDEIALLDARLNELLERVDDTHTGKLWAALNEVKDEYMEARKLGPMGAPKRQNCLARIVNLIEKGATDHMAWEEIRGLLQDRRKLVESERKRLVDAQQIMTLEEALVLMRGIADALDRHVTDPVALEGIRTDFGRLLNHRPVRAVTAGS